VRKTGGLADTVFDVDHDEDRAAAAGGRVWGVGGACGASDLRPRGRERRGIADRGFEALDRGST
jgi:hypothetical protein